MAEPLSREERGALVYLSHSATGQVPWEDIERYEATVQRAEAALRENVRVMESAWNLLDEAISSVEGGVHSGAWEMVGEAMDRVRLAIPQARAYFKEVGN